MALVAQDLPDDIMHMICDSLVDEHQFGTLFAFCTVSKSVALAAIKSLYKAQHLVTVQDDPSDEANSIYEHELIVQRWSILWRSVILSAKGKTFFPYCTYVRVLDMRDFRNLLEDERFAGRIRQQFFSDELQEFELEITATDRRRRPRLDIAGIVDAIGELLTQKTPLVETLSGTISATSLMRWIPRLARLKSLDRLWDGKELTAEVAELLNIYCPHFNSCSFFTGNLSQDEQLASFFSALKQHSLESFETFSTNGFGPQCCLALSQHSVSLRRLQLYLQPEALPHLRLLKPLTGLETLHLFDTQGEITLQAGHEDAFQEVIEWLKSCKSLRSLKLHQFSSGAALATPLILESDIRLHHLEVTGYKANDQKAFHPALAHQRELQYLVLESDWIESRDDMEVLVGALCELHELRGLKLMNISWYLSERELKAICENLPMLEELYTGGLDFKDTALELVSKLPRLTEVTFAGISNFTFQGLMAFCEELGERNHRGVLLAVDNADPSNGLSEQEQSFMRAQFAQQCGGRLEYTLFRDPEVPEFEGDSDE